MAPVDEIPTHVRLGVSQSRLILRGVFHRCPVCGARGSIVKWMWIRARCPTCDLGFQRIEGQQIGYIGLNTILCFSLTFVVLLVGTIIMIPDIRSVPLLIAALIPAGLGPVVFLPSCRLAWVGIDLIMRPLRPDEVDPRFAGR
jgi:hypothetical protein